MKTTGVFRNVIRKISITINKDKTIKIKYDNMHFWFMSLYVHNDPIIAFTTQRCCSFVYSGCDLEFILGTKCFQKCNLFQALETSASEETATPNETIVVQPAVDTSSFDIGDITYARPRQLAEE